MSLNTTTKLIIALMTMYTISSQDSFTLTNEFLISHDSVFHGVTNDSLPIIAQLQSAFTTAVPAPTLI